MLSAQGQTNYTRPPISSSRAKENPDSTEPLPESTELLLASGIQADEWMANLPQEYKACPYFADVLTVLRVQDAPAGDDEMRRKHAKRATLEDDGLICQRTTVNLKI